MKVAISHHKTIDITVPTVKPTLNEVPKFIPQSLISDDDGNQLTAGADGLLYTNPSDKRLDIDLVALIDTSLHEGL